MNDAAYNIVYNIVLNPGFQVSDSLSIHSKDIANGERERA